MSESTEPTVVKNPLNGNGTASDDDDQEDLFVSTYDSTLITGPAKVTQPASAAIEDLMNTIDLNDPPASTTPTPPASSSAFSSSGGDSAHGTSLSSQSITTNNDQVNNSSSDVDLSSTPPPILSTTPVATIPSVPISLVQPMASVEPIIHPQPPAAPKPTVQFALPVVQDSFDSGSSSSEAKKAPSTPAINTASQIHIDVSDPHKIGEGMGSYMVYTVTTKTTLPYFRRQSLSVNRRFSDFLGLHDKIQEKHAHLGRIVPPPPAKSVVGTAKIKMSKQDDQQLSGNEFLEKRRSALERYLQRNAEHPIICADPDFREFLELETELPRSTSTSALSGAGVKRMFSFVSDTVNKMTFKMDETDTWFEQKQNWIDQLDAQLRKLYASVESLIHHRKELTNATGQLAKSTAILGNCEEHNSLSCALSQLASTHEKIEKVYERQANNDFLYMAELLKDYIALIGSVREVFLQRVKCFQNLSSTEQNLTKKREQKNRLELAMKHDRVPPVEEEIRDLESKVEKAKEDFENISNNIKQEFDRFELNRIRDFKQNFIRYMESLLETQESLVECWEQFLPESKSIVVGGGDGGSSS